jgi:hypothetical protein
VNDFGKTMSELAAGVIGIAIIAVLVSRNAQTSGVIQSMASGFTNILATVVSPVTGGKVNVNSSYPSGGGSSSIDPGNIINQTSNLLGSDIFSGVLNNAR